MSNREISNVTQASIDAIFSKKYLKFTILVFIGAIAFILIHFTISFIILISYFMILRSYIHKQFMKEFAKRNNFQFKEAIDLETLSGQIFSIGHTRLAKNGVIGQYQDKPIRLFNYSYTVGSGKNQSTFSFTIFEIEMGKIDFPNILLQSKTIWRHGLNAGKEIKLEEQFKKYFRLYATENYEIEVLQIFTPELLNFLIKSGAHFNIEFYQNKIYIYDDGFIGDKKELDKLYQIVQMILDKTSVLISRLSDDFDAMHNSFRRN